MADLNKDGLDDVTGLPVNPHVNMTANPNIGKFKPLTPEEAKQQAIELDPKYDPTKPAINQSSPLAAGREALKEQELLERAAIEAGVASDELKAAYEKTGSGLSVEEWLAKEASRFENPQVTQAPPLPGNNSSGSTSTTTNAGSSGTDTSSGNTTDGQGTGGSESSDTAENAEQATDTPPEAKKATSYRLKSIMDAYNDGDIDKSTRDYLIVDAISKGLGSVGKSISNVGAAYTGGAIQDTTPEKSVWQARNENMAKSGIEAEQTGIDKSKANREYRSDEATIESKELANAKERIRQTPARNFANDAANLRATAAKEKDPNKKTAYEMQARLLDLVAAGSTDEVGAEEYLATAMASNPNVMELVNNIATSGVEATGLVGDLINLAKNKMSGRVN